MIHRSVLGRYVLSIVLWLTRSGAMSVRYVRIHCVTVGTRPGLLVVPTSRLASSSRTLRVTSASVLPVRWRRSGFPSGRMPMVT
jgi:hypothetical protein